MFFNNKEEYIGDKRSLEATIADVTGVSTGALIGVDLFNFSVEERFLWAAHRITRRPEDEAYSLMGIFGIYMPPIYGEGREHAMKRLRKNIQDSLEGTGEPQRILLDSLLFSQIDSRQTTIKDAHYNTCKWLLCMSEYLDWLDATKTADHHGFLWIKGKPGAGKSTIMKFAHEHACKGIELGLTESASSPHASGVVLGFFFNARGDILEKSVLGMYRSLLHQLLESRPHLRRVFSLLTLTISELRTDYEWTLGSVQKLFKAAILELREPLTCFIDALDECEEQQVRDMITFFDQVSELTMPLQTQFNVCFSGRYYPHISTKRGVEILLDGLGGHGEDIAQYLKSELRIGESQTSKEIQQELQSRASGVFMWVVLVVGILNREYDRGRIHALRRRLQEIPSDLNQLFKDILTRDTSSNRDELILCLQWILFAAQPLSPEELYCAVLFETEPDAPLEWHREDITPEILRMFIIDSSKGLAEVTESVTPKVQFIHQSVRDFILNSNGLGQIWPDLQNNFFTISHSRLKGSCLRYMGLSTLAQVKGLEQLENVGWSRTSTVNVLSIERFPLLEYAANSVLFHADAAGEHGLAQETFTWQRQSNLVPETRTLQQQNLKTSVLHILIDGVTPPTVCFAYASAEGGADAQILLRDDTLHGPWITYPHGTTFLDTGSIGTLNSGRSVLSHLAELGKDRMLALLLRSGRYDIDSPDDDGQTPLSRAVNSNQETVVESLLKAGANVDAPCGLFRTALQTASAQGNVHIVKTLLNHGADVSIQGGYFGDALLAAITNAAVTVGHESITTLLLEKGADANAASVSCGTALYAASAAGHEHIVRSLLKHGADVNARSGKYSSPLQAAMNKFHNNIVDLLRAARAVDASE
jgi:ankyrin repeat protein